MRERVAVILAAGKGIRMKSDMPKVIIPIAGKPIVRYVIDACFTAGIKNVIVVIGYKAEEVKKVIGDDCQYVIQKRQLGTAHALMQTTDLLKDFAGDLVVLPGDAPLITPQIIKQLIKHHQNTNADATLLTAYMDNPPPYGRIIRDAENRVIKIVEDIDATPEIKNIKEVNSSIYCFKAKVVLPLLPEIRNDNAKKEYYLTDIVDVLAKRGRKIETYSVNEPRSILGINTAEELLACEQIIKSSSLK